MNALRRKSMRLAAALAALLAGAAPLAAQELQVLMFDQPNCEWCAAWDAEIGPIYPRTETGAAAPLSRQHIRAALPEGVRLDRPARFTPTFVLLRDGVEFGRIEGYPGEDFFWGLIERMVREAGAGPS